MLDITILLKLLLLFKQPLKALIHNSLQLKILETDEVYVDINGNTGSTLTPYLEDTVSPQIIDGGDYYFFALKGGDYSRAATISNIAHCFSPIKKI